MTALLTAVVVLLGLILISLWAVLYRVVQQQGRLLLLQDEISQRLGIARQATARGLVRKTKVSFELPDLAGRKVSSADFRGRRMLLVNWNPHCGYCDLIGPDLAAMQPDFLSAKIHLVLLSRGDADANRKLATQHGLACPILLAAEGSGWEGFRDIGTPAAYLLDENGRVAEALVIGADQVPALARRVAEVKERRVLPGEKPLSQSRIERNGLKPGTPAPSFEVPELAGGTLSLTTHEGKLRLLVLTDPHCGPCDELAPHLVRLHDERRTNGLSLLFVGRGDVEENRTKATKYGFKFPVGVQRHWEVSTSYGIYALPVAFLIGPDGVIAHAVAKGVDEILALAEGATRITHAKSV